MGAVTGDCVGSVDADIVTVTVTLDGELYALKRNVSGILFRYFVYRS